MALKLYLLFAVSVTLATGQRPQFAGSRPIGYPEVYNRTTTEGLGDRFGEGDVTTPRLPLEANGDRELVDRLSKLPIDKQPFWFINWQALEANRQKPQTFPQRPSTFVDPIPSNTSTSNTKTGIPNTKTGIPNTNTGMSNSNTGTPISNTSSGNSNSNTNLETQDSRIPPVPSQAVSNSNTQSSAVTNSNSGLQNRFSEQNTDTVQASLGSAESNDYGIRKYPTKVFKPRTPIID